MRNKLLSLDPPVEFCDESGHAIGTFLPLSELEAARRAMPPLSETELERRRQGPEYSTDEVIAYLEQVSKF
jgi:hypothetical protein